MYHLRLIVAVIAIGLLLPGVTNAQIYRPNDFNWWNSVAKPGETPNPQNPNVDRIVDFNLEGRTVLAHKVDVVGFSGCDVGFGITDNYKGKKVKIVFDVECTEGQAQVLVDDFPGRPLDRTQFTPCRRLEHITLDVDLPANPCGALKAVVRMERGTHAYILEGRIEGRISER